MKYLRTNFVPDSLNSLPEEEESELSTTVEEYTLHEERENSKTRSIQIFEESREYPLHR